MYEHTLILSSLDNQVPIVTLFSNDVCISNLLVWGELTLFEVVPTETGLWIWLKTTSEVTPMTFVTVMTFVTAPNPWPRRNRFEAPSEAKVTSFGEDQSD